MDHEYDDYYPDPTPYEEQIDALVSAVKESVHEDIRNKLERLERENSELRPIKERMQEIERERISEKHELESTKRNALNEAKKMRLTELLKDYRAVIYTVDDITVHKPKCDLCDNERRIAYTTPLGKSAKENCTCKEYSYKYEIREVTAASIEHYSPEGNICVNYYDDNREERISNYHMYKPGTELEKVTRWTYFEDKNDAQAYCDWLTEKEAQK